MENETPLKKQRTVDATPNTRYTFMPMRVKNDHP